MTPRRTYVLAQQRTDAWGRTRLKFFRVDGPHHYRLEDRLRDATHFQSERKAEQVLSAYTDFDAFTPYHVPVMLYPWDVTFGPK